MPKIIRRIICLTGLFAICLVILPVATVQPAVAAESVMQCMEKCIRSEGKSEKSVCKQRCAQLPSVLGPKSGNRDCMGTYKSCKRYCPKGDKACPKTCKRALMQCS